MFMWELRGSESDFDQHVEANQPGKPLSQDLYFVGVIKGVSLSLFFIRLVGSTAGQKLVHFLFITPFLITEGWAEDHIRRNIRLNTNPQSVAIGEVFEIDRLGHESRACALPINPEIYLSPNRQEAGLFCVLKIDARKPKKLRIFAKLQAENNWAAVTKPAEINIYDEKERSEKIEKMTQGSTVQFPDNEEMLKTDPRDYSGMRKACRQSNCCLASVAYMEKHKAFRNTQRDCPSGHKGDMFRCADSIRWCEPVSSQRKARKPSP